AMGCSTHGPGKLPRLAWDQILLSRGLLTLDTHRPRAVEQRARLPSCGDDGRDYKCVATQQDKLHGFLGVFFRQSRASL
ncbi:MAG: hypothetical protein Q8R02_04270, partial [Hyphomonadaceae bacterium]|nr:hypothetical protein [Hyphomonadaceae bacterium]